MKFSQTLLLLSGLLSNANSYFTAKDQVIRDDSGRHTIFHGVNVVYKVLPYIPNVTEFSPQGSMTDQDIDNLVEWGFNFVRLGVMWEAVERKPGVYDDAYLKEVDDLINRLAAKGIYTLVDAHQDAGFRLNCGEGFPDFYVKEIIDKGSICIGPYADFFLSPVMMKAGLCKPISDYGYNYDPNTGFPLIKDCQKTVFFKYILSPENLTIWNALWKNLHGFEDKYLGFQKKVSSFFASNKNVIGYDPVNEPITGWQTFAEAVHLNLMGMMDIEQLQPFYEKAFGIYKKESKDQLMFFEPAQVPDIYPGFKPKVVVRPLGFTEAPGAEDAANPTHHVLNEHTYCCQAGVSICAKTGEPQAKDKEICQNFTTRRLTQRKKDAERLKIPLFLSEFGACMGTQECVTEITQVTTAADKALAGWSYWQFKYYKDLTTSSGTGSEGFYDFDGKLQEIKVRALTRTYIKYAQGTILSYEFDADTGKFTSQIKVDPSIKEPTVLHANKISEAAIAYYPNGYSVNINCGSDFKENIKQIINGNELQVHFQDYPTLKDKTCQIDISATEDQKEK